MNFLTVEQKKKLKRFAIFVIKELKIVNAPRLLVSNGKMGLKTTASYDYSSNQDEKLIKVNGKNRMLVDIMRSIAHELVHHKQFEMGKLKVKPPDIGGEIEDEANAVAGQLIKKYSLIDNTIYENKNNRITI
jgi:Zn-dependent peptidase ImmA (M78 family)